MLWSISQALNNKDKMSEYTDIIRNNQNDFYYNQVFVEDTLVIGINESVNTFVFEILGQDPNNDNVDVPVDLSSFTTVYISFFDDINNPVKIEKTIDDEVDLSQGLVRFDILQSEAKKILSLSSDVFYISTYSESEGESDEVSIFSGKFLPYDEFNQYLLQNQRNTINFQAQQRIQFYTTENERLNTKREELDSRIQILQQDISDVRTNISKIEAAIQTAISKIGSNPQVSTSSLNPTQPLTSNGNLQNTSDGSTESLELAAANNNQIVTTGGGNSNTNSDGLIKKAIL